MGRLRRTIALVAAALAAACAEGSGANPPDVLVIVLDDLSERDVDRIPTPAFDALAARGMRFRRAYAAPSCSPARCMLHLGRYWTEPLSDPCEGWDPASTLPEDAIGLPQVLAEGGHRTALFGKWHMGGWRGMERGEPWELAAQAHGYEVWRAGVGANVGSKSCPPVGDYHDWVRVDDGASARSTEYQTRAVLDAFRAWHGERGPEPWFALVSFQAPHAPFHSPPGRVPPGEEADAPENRVLYERMVTDVDAAVGELLAAVDRERTLVLLIADNGTPANATGQGTIWLKAKKTTYEDGIRVPMVWAGPGIVRGESRSLASLVDVLPTLAELTGARAPSEGLDGLSLVPALRGGEVEREYVFAGLVDRHNDDLAVVTERWKYREESGVPFLFDLVEDRREKHNLAAAPQHAELVARLRSRLERHR